MRNSIPRKKGTEDYTRSMAESRLKFIEEKTGVRTEHLDKRTKKHPI